MRLPENFSTMTIKELLENEWLVPRKVRHFLRTRKNVKINGETAAFHFPIQAGDCVTLTFEETDYVRPAIHWGEATRVTVLYEDEHLMIVNKPYGIKTHPNQPQETDTLLNHVAAYLAEKNQVPYVVHRLDKETSGAIVFAKNPFVLPILGRLLETKQIYRQYQAIVSGHFNQKEQTINQPIGRDRHDRRKRRIDPQKGDPAITHVQVVQALSNNQTAVTCVLETGRTHQIRVHLASEGHPIIGDPLYNPKSQAARLMLHASQLHLRHPFTKKQIVVTAAPGLW
ncbi:RluA family pseudouridine synthase [Enterococcus faecalis]|nr:RluA family pseudouridine synthase [Enterococcus faecalis]EGO8274379.1 RluA family pseudouridine synthase [Enterococcus faecalis]EGO9001533.1 RluA family pseudouridine synthase [Enterococcus faecalis]MDB1624013.1 RluA family pseudouridine synthase [Enterococcus faecalis]NSW10026.1 RluA family pseudouridine synthase [Enterococcus faecalis]RBR45201.1 23S rRNA pseudouridine synthase D [Enterococcus faecalis]